MAVTVKRGALSRIRENPGSIVIQVAEPSDPRLAAAVLEHLRQEIVDIDGGWQSAPNLRPEDRNNPKWVSEVLAVPDGPMVMVDGGFTPVRLLCTIPALVARRLEEAGVSAQVTVPDLRSPLDGLVESSRSVVLRLFGQPSRGTTKRVEVPQGWLREAARWVQDVSGPDGPLLCRVGAAPFTARGQHADALLAQWERSRSAYGVIAAGDPDSTLRLVGTGFEAYDGQNVTLNVALGGRSVSDTELLTAHPDLQALARRLADSVAYAFISLEPTFPAAGYPWYSGIGCWKGPGYVQGPALCDEIALDAFSYQILGPLHLARLGARPPGAAWLSEDRFELPIGAPVDWLPRPYDPWDPAVPWPALRRDPAIQERGQQLLSACLISSETAHHLATQRFQNATTPPTRGTA